MNKKYEEKEGAGSTLCGINLSQDENEKNGEKRDMGQKCAE